MIHRPESPFTPLGDNSKTHKVGSRVIFIYPHEEPRGVFFLRKGFIKAYDINDEGNSQIVSIFGPGSIFPLPWAFDEENPRLFYESMSDVSISIMHKKEFLEQVLSDKKLLMATINELVHLYKLYEDRIRNLELATAREKVAYRLLFLAKFFGNPKGESIAIVAPSSYQDIADALNMTRETVNRIVKTFIEEGIITKNLQRITITDMQKLSGIIGDSFS